MTANNEIGTINNISEIGKICRKHNVLFHTDATQALGKIPFDIQESNVDIASFSAHKIYGPKGTGGIYIRKNNPKVKIVQQLFGGHQEKDIRPGTQNVPGIVGFGKAVEICSRMMIEESIRIRTLRDKLYKGLISNLGDVSVNGSFENRLPANLNLCFKYVRSDSFLAGLRDIAVSTGSACSSAEPKPSRVLKAIGLSDELAYSSIRFGIGRFNTNEEIEYIISRIVETVNNIRTNSPAGILKQ
jgi:cysteine desulfurase